jgi:hypothetical protein
VQFDSDAPGCKEWGEVMMAVEGGRRMADGGPVPVGLQSRPSRLGCGRRHQHVDVSYETRVSVRNFLRQMEERSPLQEHVRDPLVGQHADESRYLGADPQVVGG